MSAVAHTQPLHDGRQRVLVVDDSAFMRALVSDVVASSGEFSVVGTARNGRDALRQVHLLNPDIVTLDIAMPEVDGLTALHHIMMDSPRAVVMLSAGGADGGVEATLRALELGAIDFVRKPFGAISIDLNDVRERLLNALRAAARSNIRGVARGVQRGLPINGESCTPIARLELDRKLHQLMRAGDPMPAAAAVVCIAASTGGPAALSHIIPRLSCMPQVAVLVAQHLPTGYTSQLAARLHAASLLTVSEARDGEVIRGSHVYIAPGGQHLRIVRHMTTCSVQLDRGPRHCGVRPAADHLFMSAAKAFGRAVVGVVLTGMGRDGADGLRAIRSAGGLAAVQDSTSAVVSGMPEAALGAAGADCVASLDAMADTIETLARRLARAE